MENIQLTQNEENDLERLFILLKNTRNGKKTELINNSTEELDLISDKYENLSFIRLLIKGLSIPKIRNNEISIESHKSLLIFFKNFLIRNQRYINNSDIFDYFQSIFNLILTISPNENLQCNTMVLLFINLVKTVLDSNNSMMENEEYVEDLLKFIFSKVQASSDNDFIFIGKNGLELISCLFSSKNIGHKHYLENIQKYLIPVGDIIFSKAHFYIIPNNNKFDDDFVQILTKLYETLFDVLIKMKRIYSSLKRRELSEQIFGKFGKFTYELIQVIPFIDKETQEKYGDANPILVFNEEFQELNMMKSKAFKFLTLIIQYLTVSSNDGEDNDDKKEVLNNKDLIEISSQLITLVIKCFENIINPYVDRGNNFNNGISFIKNEEKFNFIRKLDEERGEEEDVINIILFDIIGFLSESLTKEPIKASFNEHIKLFFLNVLFPFLITSEKEKNYMKSEPEEYCAFFNDLVYDFTLPNFRIQGFSLIKKLSENYVDIPNFILSYFIGLFNDIMNKDNCQFEKFSINNQFNAYIFYKSQNVLFDKLSEETKLDFCLLILILFQKELLKYDILKNKLREALIISKDKLEQLRAPLIKIKLCHLLKFVIPNLFNENSSQEKENVENIQQNDNNMNEIIEDDTNIKYGVFIEKGLFFLFNCLTQTKTENYAKYDLYCHPLGNEASNVIISLFNCIQTEKKDSFLKNKLNYLLQEYFHSFLDLINFINLYSFFNVTEQIIKEIKIKNRQDLFLCLDKLTQRFLTEFETGDLNSQIYCPLYFSIISSFFNGVNRIQLEDINNNSKNDENELDIFNKLYKPILDEMNDVFRFIYYENLNNAMIDYIKCFKGLNDQTIIPLKSMPQIFQNERTFSLTSYNYVRTVLYYLENNITNGFFDQQKTLENIIDTIEEAFKIDCDQNDFSNLYALLLTLQIYSKNMTLSEKFTKILLTNTMKCFEYIFKNDKKYGKEKTKIEKDIVILGILSLGYIFKPMETHNLLSQLEIIQEKEKERLYEEIGFESFNFNKFVHILSYINKYDIENELLRKCYILGFCSIFKDYNIILFLNQNKELKIKLLIIFCNFILVHKDEEMKKRNKLIKDEIKIKKNEDGKTDFEKESESESEEEEENKENESNLNNNLNYVLESNENIKNSDEYQFFKNTLDSIKQNDPESINALNEQLSPEKIQQLEEVYHLKKFSVIYQGKEYNIPRKILNIKRK